MLILKNAAIVAEGNNTELAQIWIENGTIIKVLKNDELKNDELKNDENSDSNTLEEKVRIVDCQGKLVMPGFIDVHVHLREPGYENKETIKTGTMAAAAGGFTTVMPMPNLKPVPDTPEIMQEYIGKLKKNAVIKVKPYASITKGENGLEVVDMKAMLSAGAAAFSDDGVGVQSDEVMKQAMKQAAELGTIIAAHTEDNRLKNNGYVHDGEYAKKMGWKGIPSGCEYEQVERDLELVKETGCRYHVCHVSAKETIDLIRRAKKAGLPVTCEVTPHHLTLIDKDVRDSNWKMNPPLRSKEDRQALIEAVRDGTVDIIATDHAPHTREEKNRGIEKSPFGIVGLETAFPVMYSYLVKENLITLKRLQEIMCEVPAEIFGMKEAGKIREGFAADIVLLDIERAYTVDASEFKSMGRNTPYDNVEVFGKIEWTMVDGRIVYND